MFQFNVKFFGTGKNGKDNAFMEGEKIYGSYGEDAFFVKRNLDKMFLGVLDGVNGVKTSGIDPAEFPFEFCKTLSYSLDETSDVKADIYNTFDKLTDRKVFGSSTVNISTLDKNTGEFKNYNIGDSCFMILRKIEGSYTVFYKSKAEQYSFNFPHQLSNLRDYKVPVTEYSCSLKDGDVIVMASDGLWDNLFDTEIIEKIKCENYEKVFMDELNDLFTNIDDYRRNGPFRLNAWENNVKYNTHSKQDDYTVIVTHVRFNS